MRALLVIGVLGVAGFLSSVPAAAAPLDGSAPILCALSEVHSCSREGGCERAPLEPGDVFWRVNVQQRVVGTLDGRRTSPIATVQREDGRLLLQGMQNARVWGLVLDEQTGQFWVTVTEWDGALAFTGTCAAL